MPTLEETERVFDEVNAAHRRVFNKYGADADIANIAANILAGNTILGNTTVADWERYFQRMATENPSLVAEEDGEEDGGGNGGGGGGGTNAEGGTITLPIFGTVSTTKALIGGAIAVVAGFVVLGGGGRR